MKPDVHTVIRRKPGPVETTVGTEIVLMSLDSGLCFGLGDTGSDVWRLLAEPIQVQVLVGELRQIYEAPEGEIERDVADLLEELQLKQLVEFSNPVQVN